ncbi:MAG TPA: hypothetical protein VG225_06485 [Terracidiphilus sp.]|jgi:hypothetical protein|nr:hypothetical protein [Terracidiphilus sp.]
MKNFGFTLMLFVIVLSPLAAVCQSQQGGGLPDEPAPQATTSPTTQQPAANGPARPAPPDGDWRKIQRLTHGEPIVVNSTLGPALQCRFAGATDAALFCDAPGSPDGSGYRFERATVISVESERPERNTHPAWLASMIAGGMVVGFVASGNTDAGTAAKAGAIGALVVGAIGAPLAFMPSDPGGWTVVYPMHRFRFHARRPVGPHARFMLPVRK